MIGRIQRRRGKQSICSNNLFFSEHGRITTANIFEIGQGTVNQKNKKKAKNDEKFLYYHTCLTYLRENIETIEIITTKKCARVFVCVAKRTTTNIDKMVKFIENYYYYCHY